MASNFIKSNKLLTKVTGDQNIFPGKQIICPVPLQTPVLSFDVSSQPLLHMTQKQIVPLKYSSTTLLSIATVTVNLNEFVSYLQKKCQTEIRVLKLGLLFSHTFTTG